MLSAFPKSRRRSCMHQADSCMGKSMLPGNTEVRVSARQDKGATFTRAKDAATRAATQNGANLHRGRASVIALWQRQIALAAMFVNSAGRCRVGDVDRILCVDGRIPCLSRMIEAFFRVKDRRIVDWQNVTISMKAVKRVAGESARRESSV